MPGARAARRQAVYNKAEYREQRTAMLQDWADMIDEWTLRRSTDRQLEVSRWNAREARANMDRTMSI